MQTVQNLLGVKTEEEAVEIVRSLAAPTVVLTIVATSMGAISVACVGSTVPLSLAQSILLAAVKQLAREEVLENQSRSAAQGYPPELDPRD
jgi:hypothetical protein